MGIYVNKASITAYWQYEKAQNYRTRLPQSPSQGEPRRGDRTARKTRTETAIRASIRENIQPQTREGRNQTPAFFFAGRSRSLKNRFRLQPATRSAVQKIARPYFHAVTKA